MEDSKSPDYREQFCLDCGFATRALHSGEHIGQPQHTSHTGAIYQSSTFVFESAASAERSLRALSASWSRGSALSARS